jgi:drug/metabolite transporter (DMT)-like permease
MQIAHFIRTLCIHRCGKESNLLSATSVYFDTVSARYGSHTMSEQSRKTAHLSDLISGCISGLGAMVIMGHLAKVTKPGIIDALIALMSVGAVIVTFLCIGRARVEPTWKATMIIGGAGVYLLYLRFLF